MQAGSLYDAIRPVLMNDRTGQAIRQTALANAAALRQMLRGQAESFEANVAAALAEWID